MIVTRVPVAVVTWTTVESEPTSSVVWTVQARGYVQRGQRGPLVQRWAPRLCRGRAGWSAVLWGLSRQVRPVLAPLPDNTVHRGQCKSRSPCWRCTFDLPGRLAEHWHVCPMGEVREHLRITCWCPRSGTPAQVSLPLRCGFPGGGRLLQVQEVLRGHPQGEGLWGRRHSLSQQTWGWGGVAPCGVYS